MAPDRSHLPPSGSPAHDHEPVGIAGGPHGVSWCWSPWWSLGGRLGPVSSARNLVGSGGIDMYTKLTYWSRSAHRSPKCPQDKHGQPVRSKKTRLVCEASSLPTTPAARALVVMPEPMLVVIPIARPPVRLSGYAPQSGRAPKKPRSAWRPWVGLGVFSMRLHRRPPVPASTATPVGRSVAGGLDTCPGALEEGEGRPHLPAVPLARFCPPRRPIRPELLVKARSRPPTPRW